VLYIVILNFLAIKFHRYAIFCNSPSDVAIKIGHLHIVQCSLISYYLVVFFITVLKSCIVLLMFWYMTYI
jgi:hypothetical protein